MTIVRHSISVIIPVYNSQDCLPVLIRRIEPILKSLTPLYELIFVNDCSQDDSWEQINELSKIHTCVTCMDLMLNYGHHNALLCGIRMARNEIIVTLDDDLQPPPEEIPKLIAKLLEEFDVVYGTPEKKQHGFWRDNALQISKLVLQELMGAEIARKETEFRAFGRDLHAAFDNCKSPFIALDLLLSWGTTKFAAISVRHDARQTGYSNYTFRHLVTHALNMITGFNTMLLQLFSEFGCACIIFGLGVLVFVICRYFIPGSIVPWFVFLASIIAIFSGLQLFALGIIGEYPAPIHFRTMGKPPNVIRQVVGLASRED